MSSKVGRRTRTSLRTCPSQIADGLDVAHSKGEFTPKGRPGAGKRGRSGPAADAGGGEQSVNLRGHCLHIDDAAGGHGGPPYRMRRKRASEQPAQQQVPTARSRERIAGGGGGARSGGGQNCRAWRAILHRQALCAIGSAFPAPPAQPSQQVPTNPASAAWNTPKAVRPSREVCASGSQRPFLHAFLAATTACAHSRSSNASNSSIYSGRVRKFTGSMRNQVRPLSSVVEIQKRPPCSIRLATLE